ncbi:hypothetical protein GCM10023201_33490 [Actinomycetospora corticicola]
MGAIAILMPPSYEAKVDLFFTTSDPTANASERVAGYAPLVTNDVVTTSVVGQLGLDESPDQFAKRITVTTQPNSAVLTVGVQLSDPTQTAAAANAVATSFIQLFGRLNPPPAPNTAPAVTATVVQPAGVPVEATWPSVLTLVIGAVVAVALGVAAAALRGRADPKVRTSEDVVALTGRPVLGEIPSSASGTEFRRVRTMLRAAAGDRPPRLVAVCGASTGSGSGLVGVNIAVALAHAGSRVLLVEADLQHPSISHHLGLDTRTGLTTVLSGAKPLREAARPCTVAGLSVLSAGIVDADSGDLLGSPRVADLLGAARTEYDVVVLDTAPLLGDPSAADLASRTDGTVLVAGRGSTRKDDLQAAVRLLDQVGARLLGTVVRAPGRAAADDEGPQVTARTPQVGRPTPPPLRMGAPTNGPVRTGPPSGGLVRTGPPSHPPTRPPAKPPSPGKAAAGPPADPTPTQAVVPVQTATREEAGVPSDTTAEVSPRSRGWIPLTSVAVAVAAAGVGRAAAGTSATGVDERPGPEPTSGTDDGNHDDDGSDTDGSDNDGKQEDAPETPRGDAAAAATTEKGSTA